ncbi:MAG: diacylglycerol kinase catalytic region [Frankiales bacterium]|nr:diacylglycerol kinase catalytic region [Frankiales bacterium]
MRAAVVANPTKSGDPFWDRRLLGVLERAGLPGAVWLPTTADDPGPGQARAALELGADLVVVAGGDGTVRSVVTALTGTGVPLALLPSGTGNLLARNLGIPLEVEQAAAVAATGQDRAVDVGRLADGECFAVMAGTGFDAAMLAGAPHAAKAWLGWSAYVLSGLKQLRGPGVDVEVEVDGVVLARTVRGVLVANVGELQGGIRLLPMADPADGLLDVALLAPVGLRDWLHLGRRVWSGQEPAGEVLEVLQGRRVVVRTSSPQPVQYDGDLVRGAPALSAEVVPGGLLVRVPR